MKDVYHIPSSTHILTSYGDFYKKMREKNIVDQMHQLFTYAFLVGIKNDNKNNDRKNSDIFQVQNIDERNFEIVKGIALMKIDVDNGKELINEIMKYADGGIEVLKVDYENDDKLSLQKYLD